MVRGDVAVVWDLDEGGHQGRQEQDPDPVGTVEQHVRDEEVEETGDQDDGSGDEEKDARVDQFEGEEDDARLGSSRYRGLCR